jgi:hypothetical protein
MLTGRVPYFTTQWKPPVGCCMLHLSAELNKRPISLGLCQMTVWDKLLQSKVYYLATTGSMS